MSEENKVPSGQPNDAASGGQGDSKETVDYSTYSKVLGEAKNAKLKANEMQNQIQELNEKLQAFETDKMQLEGNKDEVIEKLKSEIAQERKARKETHGKFALSKLKSVVEAKAASMGAHKPELLHGLLDLGQVKVDADNYDVDVETVDILLDDVRKENPFLFKSSGASVADVNHKSTKPVSKIKIKDMDSKQLEELYKKLHS